MTVVDDSKRSSAVTYYGYSKQLRVRGVRKGSVYRTELRVVGNRTTSKRSEMNGEKYGDAFFQRHDAFVRIVTNNMCVEKILMDIFLLYTAAEQTRIFNTLRPEFVLFFVGNFPTAVKSKISINRNFSVVPPNFRESAATHDNGFVPRCNGACNFRLKHRSNFFVRRFRSSDSCVVLATMCGTRPHMCYPTVCVLSRPYVSRERYKSDE